MSTSSTCWRLTLSTTAKTVCLSKESRKYSQMESNSIAQSKRQEWGRMPTSWVLVSQRSILNSICVQCMRTCSRFQRKGTINTNRGWTLSNKKMDPQLACLSTIAAKLTPTCAALSVRSRKMCQELPALSRCNNLSFQSKRAKIQFSICSQHMQRLTKT